MRAQQKNPRNIRIKLYAKRIRALVCLQTVISVAPDFLVFPTSGRCGFTSHSGSFAIVPLTGRSCFPVVPALFPVIPIIANKMN
jgi:hypothetical protein